jgi:hypothetical protein
MARYYCGACGNVGSLYMSGHQNCEQTDRGRFVMETIALNRHLDDDADLANAIHDALVWEEYDVCFSCGDDHHPRIKE